MDVQSVADTEWLYPNPVITDLLHKLKVQRSYTAGDGAWLEDSDGRRVLDCLAGYGSVPFGHNPEPIVRALLAAVNRREPVMVQMSGSRASAELVERLVDITPEGLDKVVFTNSGAETIEVALKAVRSASRKSKVVVAKGGFHGKTLGSLAATGQEYYQEGFFVSRGQFHYVDYDDLAAMDAVLGADNDIAAVLVEPIQGEGGVIVPSDGYLRGVRDLCSHHGVLMVVDEIQTGLGRTGVLLECNRQGVTPDCIAVSKALGGGLLPIGACIMSDRVYHKDFGMRHSSTFAGNGMACRVGSAVIDHLRADDGRILRHVGDVSAYLRRRLQEVIDRYAPALDVRIRGRGLMLGLHFDGASEAFQRSPLLRVVAESQSLIPVLVSYLLNKARIRVAPTLNGKTVMRIQPPLTITHSECDVLCAALDRMLGHLHGCDLYEILECFAEESGEEWRR